MSSNLAISLVIGASIGAAVSGINQVRSSLSALRDNSITTSQRLGKLSTLSVAGIKSSIGGLTALGSSMKALATPAIKFESAMADVKKVVDFKTPEGFKNLSKAILDLTDTIPMTAEELAAITASGGQLGVAEEDLKAFTTTIAKMSVAFDMSAQDSGDAMAKLANVYKIPIKEIDKLGDAINELSNSSPAKASDIVNTLGRVGGVAKQFGLTENAAAALSSSFISLGKAPEVAGTAINGMLTKLMTAEKGGKAFKSALKEVGISAKQLKANIAKDGQAALVDFLKRLEKLPKDKAMGVLVDLFGREYADDVAVLAGNVGVLEKSLKTLQETDEKGHLKYLGSMEKEFAARAATTENALSTLKNSFTKLAINIGQYILPVINDFVGWLQPMVIGISDWISANSDLMATIAKWGTYLVGATAGFFALLGVFSSVTFVGIKLFSSLKMLWSVLSFGGGVLLNIGKAFLFTTRVIGKLFVAGVLKLAYGLGYLLGMIGKIAMLALNFGKVLSGVLYKGLLLVGKAFMWLGRAFLMNPIGLAITAIAVGAYLIYQYWEPIKSFFARLWQGITDKFSTAWAWIKSAWSGVGEWVSSTWSKVLAFFSDLWQSITDKFSTAWAWMKSAWSGVGEWISNAWGGVTTFFSDLWEGVKTFASQGIDNVANSIRTFDPLSLFQQTFNAVINWFSIDLPAKFSNFGKNIIDGLVNGISSAWHLAKDKVSELGTGIKGWFAEKLGIHSPSRVFKGYGVNIVEGLALGIEHHTALATQNTKQLGQAVDNAMPMISPVITPTFATPLSHFEYAVEAVGNEAPVVSPVITATFAKPAPVSATQPRTLSSPESPLAHYQPLSQPHAVPDKPQGQGIVVHFNPTIQLTGQQDQGVMQQVQSAVQMGAYELEQLIMRIFDQQQRRAY